MLGLILMGLDCLTTLVILKKPQKMRVSGSRFIRIQEKYEDQNIGLINCNKISEVKVATLLAKEFDLKTVRRTSGS